ncbi:hypothetical protein JCM24511_03136 [Saitozyma sp. JCM 24511]|nr:hypothetical protein JCM24511_03136 [Saitozyma sp. JCM 24511]
MASPPGTDVWEDLRLRAVRVAMRGIEDGLGGFDDDRNEFSIALTNLSGVSKDSNLQEVLEVCLRLRLEREDGLGSTVSYEKRRAKGRCTMATDYLTPSERQSARDLIHSRISDRSHEIPANMHAADSWSGHMIPQQVARFVGTQRTWTVPPSPPPDDTEKDTETSPASKVDTASATGLSCMMM